MKRWDLGPGFYCPTCDHNPDNDKYRDKDNGCPKCPLIETFQSIRVSNASKAIERQGGFPKGWNIDSLTRVYSLTSSILSENKGRIDLRWSITFGELCRIIQQEEAQAKFEQEWITWKKIKSIK